jgi:hypothetical protein
MNNSDDAITISSVRDNLLRALAVLVFWLVAAAGLGSLAFSRQQLSSE